MSRTFSAANIARWLCRLRLYDVIRVVDGVKLYLSYLRNAASWLYRSFRSLKLGLKELDVCEPVHVFDPIFYNLFKTNDPFVFYCLNSALQFTLRLTLRDVEGQEDEAVREYVEFEKQLDEQGYDPQLLEEFHRSWYDLYHGMDDYSPLQCFFSNGATAEVARGKGVARKLRTSVTAGALQLMLHSDCADLSSIVRDVYRESHGRSAGISADSQPSLSSKGTAVLQLVPKGISEKRVISMEPSWNNFVQSGIFCMIDRYFQDHPEIGVHLHDQSRNRLLAQRGSQYRDYSTLDLHAASDSVTVSLIRAGAKGSKLLPYLLRSRSTFVDLGKYGGGVIRMQKFAPMGSMACFPVECMVFAAVIHIVELRHSRRIIFYVYGDDLVVPTEFADEISDLLRDLHFTVNETKSFIGSSFTESCGMEAFKGFDVTPMRLSRRHDIVKVRSRRSPEAYVGYLDLCNNAYTHSYFKCLRRYLIADLLRYYPETYFCPPGGEYGIWSDNPTNGHLRRRSSDYSRKLTQQPDYQVDQVLAYAPVSRVSKGPDDVSYLVTLWRMSVSSRTSLINPEDRIDVRTGPSSLRLKKRWLSGTPDEGILTALRAIRRG